MKLNNKVLNKKGFTLVELLIVIALLGALAVGMLAALDPFEQLKKGTDTGTRNTVSEVQGAVIRYFALKGWMPWCTSADAGDCTLPAQADLSSSPMDSALSRIVDTGELKSNFTDLATSNLSKIFVTGTTDSLAVCFQPQSKSFRCDPNTKYTQAGIIDTDTCDPNAAGFVCGTQTVCYWCVM